MEVPLYKHEKPFRRCTQAVDADRTYGDEELVNTILRLKYRVYGIYHPRKTVWMRICSKVLKLSILTDNSIREEEDK